MVWILIALGGVLHVCIDVFLSDRPASAFGVLGVILWPSLPYALCAVAVRFWGAAAAVGGALAALGVDVLSIYAVFVHPTSSTAPVLLLYVPLYSLVILTPLGIVAGRLTDRRRRTRM
jgi:hypothetical protein